MRAALLILVSVLSACATPSRTEALTDQRRGGSLCWWRDARWGDGNLLVRNSAVSLGRVRSAGADEVRVTATLRRAGPVVLLQGQWSGPGLMLEGDVDVGVEAAIGSWDPRRIGAVGMLLEGARLRVLDASIGSVLAVPADESLHAFTANEPLAITLRCEDLSLRTAVDSFDTQVRLAGFHAAKRAQFVGDAAVELSATFDKPTVGALNVDKSPAVYELERTGDLVRIAVPTRDNVVWIGWADGARVKPRETSPLPSEETSSAEVTTWRSCQKSQPIAVKSNGLLKRIGTLQERTGFIVEPADETGGWVSVRLALEWFKPATKMYLPREAASCAATVRW